MTSIPNYNRMVIGDFTLGQFTEAELAELRESAHQACSLMRAMANPDRLMLMAELAEGEKNVGEMQAATGIMQPTLSQQLGVLREEGLVETRRESKNIYYRIVSIQALAVMKVLYEQFCDNAKSKSKARRYSKKSISI